MPVAAAAAKILCPAGAAYGLVQHMGVLEGVRELLGLQPAPNGAQDIVRLPDELVAGIDFSRRGHRHIFIACPAAAEPFVQARPLVQFHIEVEEAEALSLSPPLQVKFGQVLVLL
jgi:hypothetical protein